MIWPTIYPRGLQPDLRARMRSRILRSTKGDLGAYCFSAKDKPSGKVVGVSWWATVEDPPSSQEELDQKFKQAYASRNLGDAVEGFQAELDEAFFRTFFYLEAEITGEGPYVCLRLLATSPQHQGHGAGALLARHGLEKADQLGLPVYLDSSINGKPLYERFGFDVKCISPLDCTKYGGQSDDRHWCMLRPARPILRDT